MKIDQIYIIASMVLRNRKGQILLLKRGTKSKHFPNFWQLPEGKQERGESPEKTMKRELIEEIGWKIGKVNFEMIVPDLLEMKGQLILSIRTVFKAFGEPNIRLSSDHTDFAWVLPDRIGDYQLVPGAAEVLEKTL